jgi:hypothetical protein
MFLKAVLKGPLCLRNAFIFIYIVFYLFLWAFIVSKKKLLIGQSPQPSILSVAFLVIIAIFKM